MYGNLSGDRFCPQWFPELQRYVEEETSPRREQILLKEEETTSLKDKSPQEAMKPPQEGRYPFPASFNMDHFNFRTCDQTSFTEKKSIAQSA